MTTARIRVPARFRRMLRSARGQGLIEAAFTLPILLSLTFGVAEMGLYMRDYVQAANCAREAARRAALRADVDPILNCTAAALKPTVPAGYKTLPAGSDVTATVNSLHNWIVIGSLIPGMGPNKRITVSVTMRMEGQAS